MAKSKKKLNLNKCQILNIRKIPLISKLITLNYPQLQHISKYFKWNDHINYVYKTASVSSYQVLKSFKTNTVTTQTKLFTVYVRPKLEFNT